ncbi:OLC1v1034166C1 [Oldenlandia corymbosa var. corymbosa]|uniref:OLC1v1034166C1 n=1 Tax=Oldenlandia corymbosa var. corymbosa TaxID=529605 RepID=A0AAV1CQP1_OLDCO|nr:OLC1v1034166C1 [Oldenlandia corymbosa var. corymbosa]
MYFNGVYHLFYQYNPKGAVWGNIVWAHSVSHDLINWIPLEPAIFPSKPFDKYGCWSGSATVLPGNKPVILYTGIIDKNNTQVQNYAVPKNISDPYLREWVKPDDNPLIVAEGPVNKTAFRDPTTAWLGNDGEWRILVGGRYKDTGMAFLYKSKDFKKWTKANARGILHSSPRTGNWECPDFYPVAINGSNGLDASVKGPNEKHVLKVSLDATRFEYYTVGTYHPDTDTYEPDNTSPDNWKGLRYDYGNFYASKSFFDPSKNRRVLWGWANESDPVKDDIKKGWAGIQLIPRTITLDPSGKQLLQWPVEELDTLRGPNLSWEDVKLEKGDPFVVPNVTGAQADVEVVFTFQSLDKAEPFDPKWKDLDAQDVCTEKGDTPGGLGPFGLLALATKDLAEYTAVHFRVFKDGDKHKVLLCSDGRRGSLRQGMYAPAFGGYVDVDLKAKMTLELRTLIDHSVVESFGENGKTCISSRVYPAKAIFDKAQLIAFNNGTEPITLENIDVYSMKSPKMN